MERPGCTSRSPQVLVFDSGVGGLSICREIIATSPHIVLDYLSDNAAFPYGEKSADELIFRASAVLRSAVQQLQPDLLVVACNTASTAVLPTLRNELAIPVVGVVPAIKTAAQLSQTATFGLLATPGTVNSDYTRQLIAEHAASHRVISVGSAELVRHIEAHLHGETLDIDAIAFIVDQFGQHPNGADIDTVVLGCTHFPLISDTFKQLAPHWQWIDSGTAIAARVNTLLPPAATAEAAGQANMPDKLRAKNIALHNALFTAQTPSLNKLQAFLDALGFAAARQLQVNP